MLPKVCWSEKCTEQVHAFIDEGIKSFPIRKFFSNHTCIPIVGKENQMQAKLFEVIIMNDRIFRHLSTTLALSEHTY